MLPCRHPIHYRADVALYAAYGSNLHPQWMAERAPHSPLVGPGWLQGWRLTFGGEDVSIHGAIATIVEDPASQVFVMVYALTDADERGLNDFEALDFGLYRRIHVRVAMLDRDVTAWLYVLDAFEGGTPSRLYLHDIVSAAEAAGAPRDYVTRLRGIPTRD